MIKKVSVTLWALYLVFFYDLIMCYLAPDKRSAGWIRILELVLPSFPVTEYVAANTNIGGSYYAEAWEDT